MPRHAALAGQFATAPRSDEPAQIRFTVLTCQGYGDLDHPNGYHIYQSMARLQPNFFVATGDNVYYDADSPRATSVPLARFHWHRMHSLPRLAAFHRHVPGYWMKDDHDTYDNDCWPAASSKSLAPFTFKDGQAVFREQVPLGAKTYRTARWGKGLQIWLVEGRDFRSPSPRKDGPDKSLWGAEQKKWLLESIKASDADWRVLISPTPIVGPDKPTKTDNLANPAWAHEGDEFRRWVQKNAPGNLLVVCGDRHWQYHSVHPQTGVREFSCGPASDAHAGGSPGANKEYHRFHRVQGGFVSVMVKRAGNQSRIFVRLHDVQGTIVHEHSQSVPIP
jgi:alkaline phosphatase D